MEKEMHVANEHERFSSLTVVREVQTKLRYFFAE